jgi:vancomycin resistance protein VanJ
LLTVDDIGYFFIPPVINKLKLGIIPTVMPELDLEKIASKLKKVSLQQVALANIAILAAIALLERLGGERFWATTLLAYSPKILWMLPSLILLPLCLAKRRWKYAAATGLVMVIWPFYAGLLANSPAPPVQESHTIRVLTFNTHFSRGIRDLPGLVEESGADIVFLQEALEWAAVDLESTMRMPEFKGWHALTNRTLVILSRYPIRKTGRIGWNGLVAECSVDGRRVKLINVHPHILYHPLDFLSLGLLGTLQKNEQDRRRIFEGIDREILSLEPVILAGDFNTPPGTEAYNRLQPQLVNAFEKCGNGFGFTYPAPVPIVRIDHIFCGSGLTPVSAKTLKAPNSNHRPLLAVLEFKQSVLH